VLITGATGFIGGWLAQRLAQERGVHVRGLARTPAKGDWLASQGVVIVQGDVTDSASVVAAMEGCSVVYHAAAWVDESGSSQEVQAVNVEGARHVVEAAVRAGVRRLVHISSVSVYGSRQQFNIDESTPVRKTGNVYGDSKVDAEEIAFSGHGRGGLSVVAVRPSQVVGLNSPHFVLRPLRLIQQGKMTLIDGGKALCKPVYIDNLVDALLLCGEAENIAGEAINVSDGYTTPWRDYFGALAEMAGVSHLRSVPYPVALGVAFLFELQGRLTGRKAMLTRRAVRSLRSFNSYSNAKAQRLLGWQPRVGFDEAMQRTEAWLRANGLLA
jgi:nucleoside-diphosphate-sugar epimerase